MNPNADRPLRKRVLYTTLELCLNKEAGTYGSLELIVSGLRSEYPTYYFWPLGESKNLSSDQMSDLVTVVGGLLSEEVYVRLNVQDEIPGLLGS